MYFPIKVTKTGVTDDVAPADGTIPVDVDRSRRSFGLPGYFGNEERSTTGGLACYAEVLDAGGGPVANGQIATPTLWLRHGERGIWVKVASGTAMLHRQAYEWKWGGLAGAELFVQLVGITGIGAASVVLYAAPQGIRS